jgi:hypothetical protein
MQNANKEEFKGISAKLIDDIRSAIKEKLRFSDEQNWRNRVMLLHNTFSSENDYCYQLEYIKTVDPASNPLKSTDIIALKNANLRNFQKIITPDNLKELYLDTVGVFPDISEYFLNDDIYFINFRKYYLKPAEVGGYTILNRRLSSIKTEKTDVEMDYIMGNMLSKNIKFGGCSLKTPACSQDFIEKIKRNMNTAESRYKLFILITRNSMCDPNIYSLLCDLINDVPQEKINIIYDYEILILNGLIQKNISINCITMQCIRGITYLAEATDLLKIYDIIDSLNVDDETVTDFLDYIRAITLHKNNIFSTNVVYGRDSFLAKNKNITFGENRGIDTYLSTLFDYKKIMKFRADIIATHGKNEHMYDYTHSLINIKETDEEHYLVLLMLIIKDMLTLYNNLVRKNSDSLGAYFKIQPFSVVRVGMQDNPVIYAIKEYTKKIFINYRPPELIKKEAEELAKLLKEAQERAAAEAEAKAKVAAEASALALAIAQALALQEKAKALQEKARQELARAAQARADARAYADARAMEERARAMAEQARVIQERLASEERLRKAEEEARQRAARRIIELEQERNRANAAEAERKRVIENRKKEKNKMSLRPILNALFSKGK